MKNEKDFFDVGDEIKTAGTKHGCKFNFGDWVWFIHDAEVRRERVQIIEVRICHSGMGVFYLVETKRGGLDGGTYFAEEKCFASKEQLIASL